nr:hypothetical protein [Candidatus Omnitrophota bacterium]
PQSNKTPPAGEDPDKPLHLEDYDKTGSCEGKRSATCMDYMELVDNCMDPLQGYRMKLTADLIEKKLKTEKLNDKQRKNLEEDLAGAREAEKNKSDNPTIAGKVNSQRHLQDISEEDQVCINADYGSFYKKIYNKCMGADHMGIGKRTEMMQDQETLTCEQAVAQLRESRKNANDPMNCLKGVTTLRFKIMADIMEKKMNSLTLTDKERADWEADIASIRELPETGAMMPKAVDPANPSRAMTRLTMDDQMTLNNEYSKQSQELMASCQTQESPRMGREPKSGGLVDKSKSPANKKAKPTPKKQYADLNKGRGGSTNLLALRRDNGCFDQIKGHLAKVTADALESKLNNTKGVSDQKRKEWEEDITAWRAAEANGQDSPEPPDPDNPYRWYDYVSNSERAAINKQHADFNNKIIKECNDRPSGL